MRKHAANCLVAVAIATATFLVFTGTTDAFEGPKRLVWCALALVLATFALKRAIAGSSNAVTPPFLLFGCALLAWMAFRSLLAAPFWRVIQPLASWILPPLLCITASVIPWPDTTRRNALRVIVVLAVAEAILMLLQRIGIDPLFGEATSAIPYAPGRMIGTVGYHNQASEFLGVAIFCVPVVFSKREVRLVTLAVLVTAVVLTANRGAILALAAIGTYSAVAYVFSSGFRNRGVIPSLRHAFSFAAIATISLALILVRGDTVATRMRELASPTRSVAVQSRLWMDRVALSLWRDHQFFGGGAGSFAYEYIDRLSALLPAKKEHAILRNIVWARESHCDPLQFASEFGIVGILLFIAFLFSLSRSSPHSLYAGAALRAAAFLTICSLFSFSWQSSLAAPLTALIVGMSFSNNQDSGSCGRCLSIAGASTSFGLSVLVCFASITDNAMNLENVDAHWEALSGEPSPMLHGRWLANASQFALANGAPVLAAEYAVMASDEWLSPLLLITEAQALEAVGLNEDAVGVWLRLANCGLLHEEALKGLSLCLERLNRKSEAAIVERERFRLWYKFFTDSELYRLCAISLIAKDAGYAELISRRFMNQCGRHADLKSKWTPEWANIRGSALLSLNRLDEARECFEDALRRKPSLISARRNLEALVNQATSGSIINNDQCR